MHGYIIEIKSLSSTLGGVRTAGSIIWGWGVGELDSLGFDGLVSLYDMLAPYSNSPVFPPPK